MLSVVVAVLEAGVLVLDGLTARRSVPWRDAADVGYALKRLIIRKSMLNDEIYLACMTRETKGRQGYD